MSESAVDDVQPFHSLPFWCEPRTASDLKLDIGRQRFDTSRQKGRYSERCQPPNVLDRSRWRRDRSHAQTTLAWKWRLRSFPQRRSAWIHWIFR